MRKTRVEGSAVVVDDDVDAKDKYEKRNETLTFLETRSWFQVRDSGKGRIGIGVNWLVVF